MKILEYAKEIKRKIKNHKTVFIVGHKDLDLDAIGSALGIYSIVENFHRQAYIIVDDEDLELGVKKIIEEEQVIHFIKNSDIKDLKSNSNLLVITDTNKINLLPNSDILNEFTDVIILDHHQTNEKSINKGLMIIDEETSSTCEMITELISNYKTILQPEIATALLSGMVLDTNNFVLKTTSDTYYSAYLLTKLGADPKKVQSYLKQDINDYIIRQQAITNVEVIKGKYAITVGNNNLMYRREELAKIADTLLQFSGIEASFVLGKTDKEMIGLSARSEGNIDVGNIAEALGGGGSIHEAASQMNSSNLIKVKEELLNLIHKEELM